MQILRINTLISYSKPSISQHQQSENLECGLVDSKDTMEQRSGNWLSHETMSNKLNI